ncbi:MAG: DUF945 family protein [Pseudomonadota bacterium]|nr:DUF945 family protein [Pseudomonadota bacterium]
MKLNKWTIAGGTILVAAGLAPWAVGYVTEQQWLQATEEVNQAQPFVRMETREYDRGVLGAEASGLITITDPATGERHEFEFDATVSHGVTGSLLDFQPRSGWEPEGANWFPEDDPQLTLETRLWGAAVVEFQAPLTTIESADDASSFRSTGGLIRLDVSDLGEQAEFLMIWPGFVMDGPDGQVRVEEVQVEQTLEWLSGQLWTGDGTMTVESLTFDRQPAPALAIRGLSIDSESVANEAGTRLNSSIAMSVDSVQWAGDAYGPHRLNVAVDNLDVASWNAFAESMTEMQSLSAQTGDDPNAAFEQQMALMGQFNDALRGVAAAGFTLGIPELLVSTPEGEVRGNLEISHPELSADERDQMLMVMQQLTGSLNLSMPLALAENNPMLQMQVAPLIKEGLVVRDGERLVLDGRLQDLVLDVNGVEIPLPPLL